MLVEKLLVKLYKNSRILAILYQLIISELFIHAISLFDVNYVPQNAFGVDNAVCNQAAMCLYSACAGQGEVSRSLK